jgi:hypothetical protein
VNVPAGTTASIHLPLLKIEAPVITESDKTIFADNKEQPADDPGITSVHRFHEDVVCELGSGTYAFAVREQAAQ